MEALSPLVFSLTRKFQCFHHYISFKLHLNIFFPSHKSSFPLGSFDYNIYACFRFLLALHKTLLHITFDLTTQIMWAVIICSRENSSDSIWIKLGAGGRVSISGRS